jgi:hypothetical protein
MLNNQRSYGDKSGIGSNKRKGKKMKKARRKEAISFHVLLVP